MNIPALTIPPRTDELAELPALKLRHIHDAKFWRELFFKKATASDTLPWDDGYRLTAEEIERISGSIQQFQLGENSEGRSFYAAAVRYAEQSGDQSFPPALKLFIQEEQRHSRYLGRFMAAQGIPIVEQHWIDDTFRALRKLAGLEIFVVVLVTAEIIACPYYRALRRATRSPLLAAICKEILRDESHHLAFQGNTLRKLRRGRSPFMHRVVSCGEKALMLGTCAVIWRSHRRVLTAGGYSFRSFLKSSMRGLRAVSVTSRLPFTEPKQTVHPLADGAALESSGTALGA